jgi:hypothetical protein
MSEGSESKGKSRSGSQKRRITNRVKVNCTPERYEALRKLADAHGQSLSALALNALLNVPLPRARRPTVDEKLMMVYFAKTAGGRDALKPIDAKLAWAGSNLNQAVHAVNAAALVDRPLESLANILADAAREVKTAAEDLQAFIRDQDELRTAGMNALGLELHHGSDDGDP